jgi:LacI family transcriptional regulator/LacI family repressor for deo operon, udp, cdd, tsx, nupC, and nupG
MDALYDNGLCVPEDVSVMGFDDLSIASRVRPALTTVHQPLKQIVKKTLDIFLGEDFDMINTAITLPYRLCVRESCRKIDQTEGFE